MSVAAGPLAPRLSRLDPQAAADRNRLLAALSAVRTLGGGLQARPSIAPSAGPWLQFETPQGRLGLAPLIAGGAPVLWIDRHPHPALAEALAALSELEPVIAGLEQACGLPLDPKGVGPAAGLGLRLDFVDAEGRLEAAVHLMIEPALAAAWPAPAAAALPLGPAAAAPAACRLVLEGPVAPGRDLGLLGVGDLVLLPRANLAGWRAWLFPAGGSAAAAGLADLARHRMTIAELEAPMNDVEATLSPPGETPAPSAGPPREWPVRIRVALPQLKVTLGALAALRPGAVLGLEGLGGGDPPVEVLADEVVVARGRLVALGEAYGVLVDEVAEPASA